MTKHWKSKSTTTIHTNSLVAFSLGLDGDDLAATAEVLLDAVKTVENVE
jgi:hypothetical protein